MTVRVGIFDSGVGGLSVWRTLVQRLPQIKTTYFADQAHIPYGVCLGEEILTYSRAIVRYLQKRGCETIVLACNTASAAALYALREEFTQTLFIGMEPAVKPAAELSTKGVIGVLATPTTLQGQLFARTAERHAGAAKIVRQVCPGLVEAIEAGHVEGPSVERLLRQCLEPCLAAGADTIVLACTHYLFVRQVIQRIVGERVWVVDPGVAIARQVERVLNSSAPTSQPTAARAPGAETTRHEFVTSGEQPEFERVAQALLQQQIHAERAFWNSNDALYR